MRCQPTASRYIAGKPFEDLTGAVLESVSFATAEVKARLHVASAPTLDCTVQAATAAHKAWSAMPGRDSGRVLRRARNRDPCVFEMLDNGKALQETLVADAASDTDCLDYLGGLAAAMEAIHVDPGGAFLCILLVTNAAMGLTTDGPAAAPDSDGLFMFRPGYRGRAPTPNKHALLTLVRTTVK